MQCLSLVEEKQQLIFILQQIVSWNLTSVFVLLTALLSSGGDWLLICQMNKQEVHGLHRSPEKRFQSMNTLEQNMIKPTY